MTKNYDLPHEEQQKLERVMQALRNVPEVGQPFDQQHADTHLDAEALLADVITMFRMGQLIRNQDDTPLVDAKNRSLPREQVAEIAQDNARASGMGKGGCILADRRSWFLPAQAEAGIISVVATGEGRSGGRGHLS